MTNTIKVLTDVPISSYDALHFQLYSSKLAQIIIGSDPRFAIGIFGSWGTGKTSLMKMIEEKLDKNIVLVVWFEAWKYDRDKYFALIPFLRQLRTKLEMQSQDSKWSIVRKGVERTLNAFADSVDFTVSYGAPSMKLNVGTFKDSLKSRGSTTIDGERIHLQEHPTDYLANAITEFKNIPGNEKMRIVVFIDDLDRCTPDKALEVLESIKAFLDIDGIVYVLAMDSNSIDTIVQSKYGPTVNGLDYLQKIVQLPFQIPTWKDGWEEGEIKKSIEKILLKELAGYSLVNEIIKNLNLIVDGVQLNPREVKRFINNVILAQSVFFSDGDSSLSIRNLIAVQALFFRNNWKEFADIITPDGNRSVILAHYKALRERKVIIPTLENILPKRTEKGKDFFSSISLTYDSLFKQDGNQNTNEYQINLLDEVERFYIEYIKQGKDLRKFLESGVADILLDINEIAKYRIALKATKDQKGENENVSITDQQMKLVYASWRDPSKDKKNGGKRMYQFHVIVNAPKATLDQIESVTYRLPPAWKNKAKYEYGKGYRKIQFKLKELAWAPFTLHADVKFEGNDELHTLKCPIVLREQSPRLPV